MRRVLGYVAVAFAVLVNVPFGVLMLVASESKHSSGAA